MRPRLARATAALHARLSPLGRMDRHGHGPADAAVARLRLPLDRAYLRRHGFLGELERLAAGTSRRAQPTGEGSPRVLVCALRAWTSHTCWESVLAQALRLRGAEVALLTCGGGQPICEMGWARRAAPRPCDRCGWFTDRVAEATGITAYGLADGLPWGPRGADAPLAPPPGGAVNPAWAGSISAPWFVKTPAVGRAPDGAAVLRDFAVAARGVESSVDRVLDAFAPDVVLMVSGLFTAERVIRERALVRGARVTTYEVAPRAGALVLSHDTPAPMYDMTAAWDAVRDRPLDARQQTAIERLMSDRARGVGAHERYFDAAAGEARLLRERFGATDGRRLVSLFTNITWDSAALDRDVGFDSMLDWIESAARALDDVPDAELVVRLHPGEARWGTSDDIAAIVAGRLGGARPRVHFVAATEPLDSYQLMDASDLVLTYASTVGMEAAVRGIPVAVAGDTHYRGRGFTEDVEGPADLARALAGAGAPMGEDAVKLAWRYAFTFFFRTMIPMPAVQTIATGPTAVVDDPARIAPGADRHIDFLCDAILTGSPPLLPDELAL